MQPSKSASTPWGQGGEYERITASQEPASFNAKTGASNLASIATVKAIVSPSILVVDGAPSQELNRNYFREKVRKSRRVESIPHLYEHLITDRPRKYRFVEDFKRIFDPGLAVEAAATRNLWSPALVNERTQHGKRSLDENVQLDRRLREIRSYAEEDEVSVVDESESSLRLFVFERNLINPRVALNRSGTLRAIWSDTTHQIELDFLSNGRGSILVVRAEVGKPSGRYVAEDMIGQIYGRWSDSFDVFRCISGN